MTKSDDIKELATALAKAQGEIQNVTKDAKNPHFKSDYATLDAITDTVRPAFAKHGLAIVQMPGFADGIVTVETLITHSSGQWITGHTASPVAKADPQGIGSATTYLRRYSLAAIAALAQTDDDGNAASQGNGQARVAQSKPSAPDGYLRWLHDFTACADNGVDALREAFKASKPEYRQHLTAHDAATYDKAVAKATEVAKRQKAETVTA